MKGCYGMLRDVSITDSEEVICFPVCAMFARGLSQQILLFIFSSLPCDATTELNYLHFNVGWLININLCTFCKLQKKKIQLRSRHTFL